jgi:hypothetical protein
MHRSKIFDHLVGATEQVLGHVEASALAVLILDDALAKAEQVDV